MLISTLIRRYNIAMSILDYKLCLYIKLGSNFAILLINIYIIQNSEDDFVCIIKEKIEQAVLNRIKI